MTLALRVANAPAGISLDDWEATTEGWRARLRSALGAIMVEIGGTGEVVGYRTTLEPAGPVKFPYWPRDLFPLGDDGQPHSARGTVHFHQRGPRTGLIYGELEQSSAVAFLYHQDLTALNRGHGGRRVA